MALLDFDAEKESDQSLRRHAGPGRAADSVPVFCRAVRQFVGAHHRHGSAVHHAGPGLELVVYDLAEFLFELVHGSDVDMFIFNRNITSPLKFVDFPAYCLTG